MWSIVAWWRNGSNPNPSGNTSSAIDSTAKRVAIVTIIVRCIFLCFASDIIDSVDIAIHISEEDARTSHGDLVAVSVEDDDSIEKNAIRDVVIAAIASGVVRVFFDFCWFFEGFLVDFLDVRNANSGNDAIIQKYVWYVTCDR